jgi:hypothetical protein
LLACSIGHFASAQASRKKNKGPRALGLLELAPDGKARLIPITIMVDGKFYDASAYKASPVPLALWNTTVYEAESNGVSQGLFTVGGAVRAGNNWFAEGKFQPAGSAPAKPKSADTKPVLDNDEGPPTLRRPEGAKSQPSAKTEPPPPAEEKPTSDKPPASAPPQPDAKTSSPAPNTPSTSDSSAQSTPPAPQDIPNPDSPNANDTDPNRPVLHRGKTQTLTSKHPAPSTATKGATTAPAAKIDRKTPDKKSTQLIPAISDAGGPDPRPYAYDLKPDEDQMFRNKMLAMTAEAIEARAKQYAPQPDTSKPVPRSAATSRAATKPKTPKPVFDDVQFRAFDLWNTNEPVFVLTANAHMPRSTVKNVATESDLTYFITLVAKADIYGELRKLQTNLTDDRHLDQIPRLELIDAVDADGDGRGEFLFREVSDTGSTWAVYRAGADQLFPLFQGTPVSPISVHEDDSADQP